MSLGKIWNSLTAASIENSLSLVQVNFDFTIQKTVAPLEYRPVGQALSDNRRLNAENGTAHRRARKLGWLFGQLIPNTPELLKAYGRRVCQILQEPGINPTGWTLSRICWHITLGCGDFWHPRSVCTFLLAC